MHETTLDSAAAAVLVLDRAGSIVTSFVRSGRLTGKGAMNACSKGSGQAARGFQETMK
jgi:hypothetical protein